MQPYIMNYIPQSADCRDLIDEPKRDVYKEKIKNIYIHINNEIARK